MSGEAGHSRDAAAPAALGPLCSMQESLQVLLPLSSWYGWQQMAAVVSVLHPTGCERIIPSHITQSRLPAAAPVHPLKCRHGCCQLET